MSPAPPRSRGGSGQAGGEWPGRDRRRACSSRVRSVRPGLGTFRTVPERVVPSQRPCVLRGLRSGGARRGPAPRRVAIQVPAGDVVGRRVCPSLRGSPVPAQQLVRGVRAVGAHTVVCGALGPSQLGSGRRDRLAAECAGPPALGDGLRGGFQAAGDSSDAGSLGGGPPAHRLRALAAVAACRRATTGGRRPDSRSRRRPHRREARFGKWPWPCAGLAPARLRGWYSPGRPGETGRQRRTGAVRSPGDRRPGESQRVERPPRRGHQPGRGGGHGHPP